MSDNKSYQPGCGTFLLGGVLAIVAVCALLWNVKVGETPEGASVEFRDYVNAVNPFAVFFDPEIWKNKPNASTSQNKQSHDRYRTPGEKIDRYFYDLLKPGLTTESLLEEYLGKENQTSSTLVGGVEINTYTLRNEDGSLVFLVFENGVLRSKGQRELK